MIKKTTLWRRWLCPLFFFLTFFSFVSAQYGPTDDFDGDGIINSIDLDDDNDGILDVIENNGNGDCDTSGGVDISTLAFMPTSGNSTVVNTTSSTINVTAGNSWNSDYSTTTVNAPFYFEFTPDTSSNAIMVGIIGATQAQPTGLNSYSANSYKFHFMDGFNYQIYRYAATAVTGKLYSGGDKFSIEVNASNNLIMKRNGEVVYTNPITTGDTQFKIQISVSAARTFSNVVFGSTNTITTTCQGADSDSDGILNSFELDSDNDGCSDAYEAGVTTNPAFTQFPITNVGANGFENSLETTIESGVYNGVYTYQYAINGTASACVDSDGDGIRDIDDKDDDNDGVPDTLETISNCGDGTGRTISWDWEDEKTLSSSYAYFSNKPEYRPLPGPGIVLSGAGGAWRITNIDNNGTLANAIALGEYQYAQFTTREKGIYVTGWLYYVLNNTGFATQPKMGILIDEDPNFGSPMVLNDGIASVQPYGTVNTYENLVKASNPTYLYPNTTYYVRFYDLKTNGVNDVSHDQLGLVFEGVSSSVNCGGDFDTDGDTVPNRLDLDSDGDGCSDRVESGVSPVTDVITPSATNNIGGSYGITNPAGAQLNPTAADANNDGINDSIDPDQNGFVNYSSSYQLYAIITGINACTDTDGDGIVDLTDIDDDNDGVLDAVESPSCFYTATEAATIAIVSTPLPNDDGVNVNLPFMHDGVATNLAASNNVIEINQAVNGAIIYNIEYPTAVKLTSISHYGTTFGTSATAKIQGSNDKIIWDELMTAATAATANPKTFTINNNATNSYRYYRIVKVAGTTTPAITTYEISSIQNTADYNPSAHPKSICIDANIDNDGIPPHHDLDTDGDGCSDSVEAGNTVFTSNNTTTFNTGTDANQNGLLDQFESSTTPGTVNYNSTYPFFAVNSAISACLDSDGDTVPDIVDIDDDNDGVLDVVETNCPPATGSPTISAVNGTVIDNNEFSYWESAQQVIIDYPYSFQNFNTLFYSVDTGDNFTVTVKLDDGTIVGPLDGRMFSSTSDPSWVNRWTTKGYPIASSNVNWNSPLAELTGSPFNPGDIFYTSSYPNNLQKSWGAVEFTVPQTSFVNGIDQIIITIKDGVGATAFVEIEPLNIISSCADVDTDNDGIPNRLDLDSDGDGCPDTKEAILYNHSTEASIPGTVKNGSGGAVTSTTANVPNAMVPGPYRSNGFADALQSASNSDAYKYVYSYLFVATNADVSTCDNKFLLDIDSDDDGIPDAVESPSCFYTEAQAMDITEGVTSDFTWAAANPLSNTYDNNTATTNYGAVTPAVSIQNKALITFDLPVIDAALVDNVKLNVGGVAFGTGKWKLQGLDIMTNTWTDLSATAGQVMNTISTTFTFTNTLQASTRYHSYRIIGIDNVNTTNNARLIEFTIQYKNYNASYHRTKMGCNSDADGDGVPNYIDRDSDGDGCPDAIEAGIPLSKLVPGDFYNIGGNVPGTHVIVGGAYGDNGMGDDVETVPDSGIVNYTSTYIQYGTNKTLNFCTDTDGDSVPDLIDIDDDNDGVLDLTECAYPAVPTTTSTNDIFAVWSNTTTAAGTNLAPTYLTSVGSWTPGSGLTAAISTGAINLSNVNGNSLADAFGANEYLEHPFTTTADNYNWLYYVRTSTSTAANYHWAMLISDDNFVTYTILNIDMARNGSGAIVNDINDYMLSPSTSYKVRTYFWGATAFPFDEFTMFGYSECDTDNDGLPNRLDLDSDGEGCPDAVEAGTAAQAGVGNTSTGTLFNTSGTQTGVANAIVGNNTPVAYGANGFYTGIENNDTPTATYIGTYTYASAINAAISSCFCYKTPAAGTGLDTNHGITSLQRAGADNSNWPMVRKGAWTALESKTKAFVPNRLTITEINNIPAANLKEGMMVYNISSDCIYINTDGTAAGWKCFNTQTCP